MTVEIDDIREILLGVTNSLVPDDAVSFWIDLATDVVEANIGEDVTDAKKNRAIKVLSCFYTLQSYATYLQTSSGRVPNTVGTQLAEFSKAASVMLSIISRSAGPMAPPTTIIATTKTLLDA